MAATKDPADFGTFEEVDGIVVVSMISDVAQRCIEGFYVIGIKKYEGCEYWSMVCADDPPVRRIRTFDAFAAARRFMSSLVLRGVTRRMRVLKADKFSVSE